MVIIPLALVKHVHWGIGGIGCRFYIFLEFSCITAGIHLIVVLSLDRYLMLAKEYGDYIRIQTRKRIIGLIVIAWTCAVIPAVLEIALWDYFHSKRKHSQKPDHEGNQEGNWEGKCVSPAVHIPTNRLVPITSGTQWIIFVLTFAVLFLVHLCRL